MKISIYKKKYNEPKKILFKIVHFHSIKTSETINVGIIFIDDDYNSITYELFNEPGYMELLLPIYQQKQINSCKNMLDIKLKFKNINENKIKITRSIHLSETRVYTSSSDKVREEIFKRYITILRTKEIIEPFYKKDLFFDYIEGIKEKYSLKKIRRSKKEPEEIIYSDNYLDNIGSDFFKKIKMKKESYHG